ncbi:MAG: Rieske 2Fe-2S domain-containing protein [Candidatus Sungbacteria bacterium]|nr:Rieske 2Fe-2S domain-containing protein [Candidatus Sungbacteria bacterium]
MKAVCNINDADLQNKGWKVFDCFGGKTCLILKDENGLRGFVNVCPHMGGPTAPHETEDGRKVLKCQWHGSEFDIISGATQTPPAAEGTGLRTIKLSIENETIYYS